MFFLSFFASWCLPIRMSSSKKCWVGRKTKLTCHILCPGTDDNSAPKRPAATSNGPFITPEGQAYNVDQFLDFITSQPGPFRASQLVSVAESPSGKSGEAAAATTDPKGKQREEQYQQREERDRQEAESDGQSETIRLAYEFAEALINLKVDYLVARARRVESAPHPRASDQPAA